MYGWYNDDSSGDDSLPSVHDEDLLSAVRNNEGGLVGSLILSRGINVNARIHNDKTALCFAASRGLTSVVRTLLELNADPRITCRHLTALHYACKNGRGGVVALLCHYASYLIEEKGKRGDTPLHMACISRHDECIKILCESGASVNWTNKNNNTPLHLLFDNDDDVGEGEIEPAARTLMKFGACVDARSCGMTALHLACKKGFIDSVKFLLNGGAAVNAQDNDGRTPLHLAVQFKRESVTCFLLDNGASVSLVDKQKKSPLHVAAQTGNMKLAQALVSKGMSINEQDNGGRTPLLEAVISNNVSVACYLLDSGADANVPDEDTVFPLFTPAEKGSMELLRALVNKGAAVNQQDDAGRNALCLAVYFKQESAVRFLLDNGADPNALFDKRLSPLHFAAESGQMGIISALVNKGASVNEPNDAGETSLHIAALRGHETAALFLLENGAAVNTPNNAKNSPLHVSAENGRLSVVQALVSKGASVNEQNDKGRTPLHLASRSNHHDVVLFLLERGASIRIVDSFQQSPLHVASYNCNGNREIIEVLISYGSDVNLLDKYNRSALRWAISSSAVDAAQVLATHKADVRNFLVDDDMPEYANALYMAAFENEAEIIKVLGSMFTSQEKDKAAQYAAGGGSLESLKMLVEMGADVDFIDSDGWTALHHSSSSGSINCVEFLLSAGMEMDKFDKQGKTPLLIAAEAGNAEVVQVLLKAGASAHTFDSEGGCPLTYACADKDVSVVRLLLEYEAGFDVMCPHKDMTLLHCLYLQHINDIMMVDMFERVIIRVSKAGLNERVLEACLVENFPDTCDWSSAVKSRREKYRADCGHELRDLADGRKYWFLQKERSFPGTEIMFMQALKQDPNVLSRPELATFLQPKHKSLWEDLEKRYPMYGRLTRIRLQIAVERASLIDKSSDFFYPLGLTVYTARMICEYLTNYDLRTISSLI